MADDRGVKGHITVEKSRVWDLKSTGQVSSGVRSFAAINCICFHPIDPTLCVVTVQGPLSILSFYNTHSGGKMSTVPLRSVVAAAQFTNDGEQIVVVFRDWNVMLLRPGSPRWTRTLIPFKKEPKPAEQIALALNPASLPVIYFASVGQPRLNVVQSEMAPTKGSLRTSHKNAFSLKLTNSAILGLATHPVETDILYTLFADGTLQAFALEQAVFKKLFFIGGTGGGESPASELGPPGQLEVLPHPFLPNASLILLSSGQTLQVFVSNDRSEVTVVDKLPLKGFKKVTGLGIYKPAQLLLAFGETVDGKIKCCACKISGNASTGLKLTPVSTGIDSGATDVSLSQNSVSGMISLTAQGTGGGSWMELWDAVPTWAQNPAQIGSSRQKIRTVKIHSVMDAIAAQVSSAGNATTGPHVLLWRINDTTHPSGGSSNSLIIPQHTSLAFWSGAAASTNEYKLEFPHHCYCMTGNGLTGYGLRTKEMKDLLTFNPPNGRSGPAKAESVVYSKFHRAWLIFFRSFSAEVMDSMGSEEWTYTLLREDEVGASPPWFKPGISGAFIGPKEDHVCILDPDLFTLFLYATKTVSGNQSALLTLALPAPGLLTPVIFAGPPITQIPEPPPPPEFTQSGNIILEAPAEEEVEIKLGFGVIIWVNQFRQIAMGSMMPPKQENLRSRYDTESIEDIQGGTFSELSDGEIIIQVAWQTLSDEEEATQEPNSYTCVVLTNQRLMLFLANGYPVLSYPPQNSPGLASPATSCLWIGPALLYVTKSGEVNQLLWDGTTVMICGAPSTTGSAYLVAALADRILFMCRDDDTQTWQVSTRHAIIGFALLMGWATLASSGLMPPSWANAHARSQMKIVVQHFDLTTISAPVAKALVQSDFADVARIIANRWSNDAQKIKVACSVAAGEWKEAAASLRNEHEISIYYPGPIPRGSTLWKRFYSVALGALGSGSTEVAADLFSSAGEWEWALAILALSSNFSKSSEILQAAEKHLTGVAKQRIQSIGKQFTKSRNQTSISGPLLGERVQELGDLNSWSFAVSGFVTPMFTVQGESPQGMIKSGDIGPIAPLETKDIKGYVSGASKQSSHVTFMRRSMSSSFSGRSILSKASDTQQQPQPQSSGINFPIPEALEVGGEQQTPPPVQLDPGQTPSPSSKPGFSDLVYDEPFSSDEDDPSLSNELERGGFGKKFKIQIKKKEESHNSTSADALREAAKNLRLGTFTMNSSLGPSGFANALKGPTLARTDSVSSKSSSTSNLDQRFTGTTGPLMESGSDPFSSRFKSSPDPTPREAFQKGIQQMEAGQWDEAIDEFSKEGVLEIPKGKQYLAAVLLLRARVGVTDNDAARIDRFAAALDLEEKHKKALATQAIKQNMECGNYGYASEKLSWLLNASSGTTSSQFTSTMMQQLDECNRQGGKNNDISPFENLTNIVSRIEAITNEIVSFIFRVRKMGVDGESEDEFEVPAETGLFGGIDFDEEQGGESGEEEAESVAGRGTVHDNRRETTGLERRVDTRQIPLASISQRNSPTTEFVTTEDDVFAEPPLKKKSRTRRGMQLNIDELREKVFNLLSRMESAADSDFKSNAARKPAIEKLKLLSEVDEACIQRQLQPILIEEGILGVLKSWIEPLDDGSLPNEKIRSTVLKILHKLPIDTADNTDRKNLQISQIGSRVMLLSRVSQETAENRKLAWDLVQKWSRPIFEQARRDDDEESLQDALSARRRRNEAERLEEERKKILKPGDPDFKPVASRPKPSRLDYVIKPKSRLDGNPVSGSKKKNMIQNLSKLNRKRSRPNK
eukprot:g1122.t1